MVGYCCVPNCRTKYCRGFSFHKFPDDKKMSDTWCRAIGRNDFIPTKHSKICSKHFTRDSYMKERFGFPTLIKGAVPSIFPFDHHFEPICQNSEEPPSKKEVDQTILCEKPPSKKEVDQTILCEEEPPSKKEVDQTILCEEEPLSKKEVDQTILCESLALEDMNKMIVEKETVDKIVPAPQKRKAYIRDFNAEDLTSPKKQKLFYDISIREMTKHRKQIKFLQHKVRRLEKKVQSLESLIVLEKEKNLKREDAVFTLESTFPEGVQDLFVRCKNGLQTPFSPALRSFALTLHCHSAKAYEFVRKTFGNCLPHPKTLSKWHSTVSDDPGFMEEIDRALEFSVDESENLGECGLMLEEMPIKEEIK